MKISTVTITLAIVCAIYRTDAFAATIPVNNGKVAILADGKCSLIEAVENANGGSHTDCVAGDLGHDTIALPKDGKFTLTELYDSENGLPPVTTPITMECNGATITRKDLATEFRIFAVHAGGLKLNNCTISGGVSYGHGGGIANLDGALWIERSTISGNFAYEGGGVYNSGRLTIVRSTISNNSNYMTGAGGGIFHYSGAAAIGASTISGNNSGYDGGGGGIYSESDLAITGSTLSENTGGWSEGEWPVGGGIYSSGSLIIARTIVAGNTSFDGFADEIASSGTIIHDEDNLFGHNGVSGVSGFVPAATDIVPTQNLKQIIRPLKATGKWHTLPRGSQAIDGVEMILPVGLDQRLKSRPKDGDRDGIALRDIGAFELQ